VADGTGFHGDGDGDSDGDGEAADDSDGADGGPDYETIRLEYEADGRVAHIVLDRPHRLNTITLELTDELEAAVDHVTAEEGVRAILVTGAGDRAFSAGADIQASASAFGDNLKGTEISRAGQAVCSKLEAADCPVLMGVDGYCLGGGMEIAMAGDMRIASRRSEFGQPEHNLGLLPGCGGTQRLQRIVGVGRAKEIIFTADRYEAETMADYGLVNEVTDNDALLERAIELATDLANGPPVAQRLTKRAMHRGWGDMEAGLEIEAQGFGHLFSTDDLAEGATAFMGDRDPEFEGH
jgi:enoyl-CoA hydratase/3-hydroxyacyl-CoA dehydrogenase